MDNKVNEILIETRQIIADVKMQLAELEDKLSELENYRDDFAERPIIYDSHIPDSIELDDLELADSPSTGDSPEIEEESLFGDSFEQIARKMHTKSVMEAAEDHRKEAVLDSMSSDYAWKIDMPGSHVNDVRSAISLNDRVLFINNLFGEDVTAFQQAIAMINSASSLDEVISFIETSYPGWNLRSEIVYRFMMAVRRKI